MTDCELVSLVVGTFQPGVTVMRGLRRNGLLLLALPENREGAAHALGLYQPQRPSARVMVAGLRGMARFGLHECILPKIRNDSISVPRIPLMTGIEAGTCGVLLGSPEHRVRRAIASYRNAGQWEVAKISFGEEGARVLKQEAKTLDELQTLASGVPRLLGLHDIDGATLLRMPYLDGKPVALGESGDAIQLLSHWTSEEAPKPINGFPEWPAIESALSGSAAGSRVLEKLTKERLTPVICHGDFTRWNLRQRTSGSLVVLDWEWGHRHGMPGIDLVHYFLQDDRLVRRLPPKEAIAATLRNLQRPECAAYLARTGWSGDPLLPIIASLAYKQGAGHQENAEVLQAAVARY